MRKASKKKTKQVIKLSPRELRAHYFSRLNQLGEDREALLKLVKDFFTDAFDIKSQISFDDLHQILEHKRLSPESKGQVLSFGDYLVEAEYSPYSRPASFSSLEDRFRKIVFLVTMHAEEEDQNARPVKKIATKYVGPLRKLYRHFVLPPEETADLDRFNELQKKCIAFAKKKKYAQAKLEYAAILKRYQKLSPAVQVRAYTKIDTAHDAVLSCLPHEARLQKLLNTLPKKITKSNRTRWKETYGLMVQHYQHLTEGQKQHYYDRIRTVRLQIRQAEI